MKYRVDISFGGLNGFKLGTDVDGENIGRLFDLLCSRVLKMDAVELGFFDAPNCIENILGFECGESSSLQMSKQRPFTLNVKRIQ